MPQEIAPRIVVDPKVRFGKLVIQGTRVPAEVVIGKLGEILSQPHPAHPQGSAPQVLNLPTTGI